jgi:uncharacterized membrane protein YqaE (UPF0057 family)
VPAYTRVIHAEPSQIPLNDQMADLIRVILSIIVPPVGVFFKVGFGMHFWLNIVLTMLGYIPGLVHAIWVLASKG